MHSVKEKLTLIRALMNERGVDAYIISDTDPHISEYVPDYWRIIRWLTGFTGSAGTFVLTQSFAGFWTDYRYLIQADKQLSGSGVLIMPPEAGGTDGYLSWITGNLEPHSTLGLDGRIFSISIVRKIRRSAEEKNIRIDIECDLISEFWTDRPALPAEKAFDHLTEFSGRDRNQKLIDVREEMKKQSVDYHLLTSPDDIMWLLNIRGRDIKYSPLLLSFAIIGPDQVLLFTDEEKITYKLAKEFDNLGIILLPYEEAAGMLSTIRSEYGILISPATTSAAIFFSIDPTQKIKEDLSIPARMKAVKNSVEIASLGKTMIRDGVTLTKFFYRVENDPSLKPMTELSLTAELNRMRSEQRNFICISFSTIMAYNEHAALPHYTATPETDVMIGNDGILLVDSGGQYLDGTTDVTRTICLGKPTGKQKKDFTLVLKGMIALATASFPAGTFGYQLDALARKSLWQSGLNYGHGTGHGVGYCLNVHEGPHRISPLAGTDKESYLKPGMIVSDEPGVYREGEYGIRTENLLLCYEDEETESGKFNRFTTLSLCYIDTSLVDITLLDRDEITWLNTYHTEVFEKLSPHLTPEEQEWLKSKTNEILSHH